MTKIYFQTHGCTTNLSESEVMMGLLKQAKFQLTNEPEEADILIINICTVKGEEVALRNIRKLHESFPNKKLVVAGCITKSILKQARGINEDLSFINTHNIKSIVEVIEEVINDNSIEATGMNVEEKILIPKIRKNPIVGVIPILNSCAGYCSYCSVKYVKGKLLSYPLEHIKQEAVNAVKDGCKELWITSQDNAAYDLEKSNVSTLPNLINEITSIPKDFFLRIGMMNPTHVLNILDDLIEAYKNKKVFKFLHLPIQSANNEILKLMKRNYTVDDFNNIIKEFKKSIPNITISTDIIVGFPSETEAQFNDSLNLVKELKPEVLNISRFQPRPGTEAAKLPNQVYGGISKDRSGILTDIFRNIARMNNEKWYNQTTEIIIDEKGKNNTWVGRNIYYRPVIVSRNLKLGDIVKVKINQTTTFDLRGEIIN